MKFAERRSPPERGLGSDRDRKNRDVQRRQGKVGHSPLRGLDSVESNDRERALGLMDVSRETLFRLDLYVDILRTWNKTITLISAADLRFVWTRHIADSMQLLPLCAGAKVWVDIGSGAGFPGLIVAASTSDIEVHCIERDVRKAAFLREAVRSMGVPVTIHNIGAELAHLAIGKADVVTARALGSLATSISLATPWLQHGAIGIFPRGRAPSSGYDTPLARRGLLVRSVQSVLDSESTIVLVTKAW